MKRKMKGMLTLEAALVMPVVLSTVVAVITFLFYLYNRNVMEDAAALAVMQTVYLEGLTDEEIEGRLQKKCTESVSDRLLAVEDLRIEVKVDKDSSVVTLKGKLMMPAFRTSEGKNLFGEIFVSAKSDRISAGRQLRFARKMQAPEEWLTEGDDGDGNDIQKGYEP